MQRRRLGRLGHDSSVLLYGGAALAEVDQDVADASVREALDAGINHFDVAADYGEAELRLGALMDELRPQVFLATRPGGALEAAVRAQEEGLVGAVGITGHGRQATATHLEALRRFPFATVLTPLNAVLWRDERFRDDWAALVEEVRRQDAGLMTIKTVSRRNWPGVAEGQPVGDRDYATWYEPLVDPEQIRAAVSWVLAHEEVTGLATAGDVRLLRHLVAAEREPMDVVDAEAALAGVEDYSSPFVTMPF
jgi:aryl-alcohol dehydrogenase-like predicted oxidoreductase